MKEPLGRILFVYCLLPIAMTISFGACSFVSLPAKHRRNALMQETRRKQFNSHNRHAEFSQRLCNSKIVLHSSQIPTQNFRGTATAYLNNADCCTSTACISKEEVASRNLVMSFIDTHNKVSNTTAEYGNIDSYQSIVDTYFADTIEVIDTSFYLPILGKEALQNAMPRLFHVNGTHLSMHVKFASIASDTLCPDDIKVAVCYEYDNDNNATRSISGFGISIYTVHKAKITQVFDVKDGANFDIASWRAEDITKMKTPIIEVGTKAFFRDATEGPSETMQRFFDARNKKSLEEVHHNISDDSSLKSFGMDKWASKDCESFSQSLKMLPDSASIELEDIVAPTSANGITFTACRWVVAIDGQRQRFSRGCSFFCFENGSIVSMIDIPESVKQEEFSASLGLKPASLNFLRDSGLGRTIADSLLVASIPIILKSYPKAIPTFADLTLRKTHIQYGEHSSQFIDLFLPRDDTKRRGLIFFVHGGAWGSGKPWMYRLIAKPFLEANMAVAIVGYRTYPDGNIQSQVNDLEAASKEIALNNPTLCSKPLALAKNEWTGTILLGHSSGAHIAILKLAQQIERWSKIKDVNSKELGINFDQVIGLSGVYSINEHFDLESGRGVEEISPMKPGCGYTMDSFDLHSPAVRLAAMSTKRSKYLKLPDMLLIHGVNDDVVPFSSAKRAANILQNWGYDNVETHYLKSTGHQDTIMHLMFGGVARDFIFSKILQLKARDI